MLDKAAAWGLKVKWKHVRQLMELYVWSRASGTQGREHSPLEFLHRCTVCLREVCTRIIEYDGMKVESGYVETLAISQRSTVCVWSAYPV